VALERSTFADKQFLSNLTESPAASTASVRTATEDGVLLLDSVLTLVNGEGTGASFAFGFAYDPRSCGCDQPTFNDYASIEELRGDVVSLMDVVQAWGYATLGAVDDFIDEAAAE
jgi:hypothetical protein